MLAMHRAQCCGHTCHRELLPTTSIVVWPARTVNSFITSFRRCHLHTLNEKSAFRQRESNSVDRLMLFWLKFVNWHCLVWCSFNQLPTVESVHGSTSDVQSCEVPSPDVHSPARHLLTWRPAISVVIWRSLVCCRRCLAISNIQPLLYVSHWLVVQVTTRPTYPSASSDSMKIRSRRRARSPSDVRFHPLAR